ncbi:hypothetical protein GCM10023178_10710 [Actinomadura luteofluorescens]
MKRKGNGSEKTGIICQAHSAGLARACQWQRSGAFVVGRTGLATLFGRDDGREQRQEEATLHIETSHLFPKHPGMDALRIRT